MNNWAVEIWIRLGRMFRIADPSIIQPLKWHSWNILFVSHKCICLLNGFTGFYWKGHDNLTIIILFFYLNTLYTTHIQAPLQLFKVATLSKMPVTSLCKTMKQHDPHYKYNNGILY